MQVFVRANWERGPTGARVADDSNPDKELLLHEWLGALARLAHARYAGRQAGSSCPRTGVGGAAVVAARLRLLLDTCALPRLPAP